jgi:hypothetical protein
MAKSKAIIGMNFCDFPKMIVQSRIIFINRISRPTKIALFEVIFGTISKNGGSKS